MSDYSIRATPSTGKVCFFGGILAIGVAGAPDVPVGTARGLSTVSFRTDASSSTFDQVSNMFNGAYEHPDRFMDGMANFYAKLAAAQEPLGSEFERVLQENLWDLYEE